MSSKREVIDFLEAAWSIGDDPRFYELENLIYKKYPYPLSWCKDLVSAASSFKVLCKGGTLNDIITALLDGLADEIPQWDIEKDPDKVIEEAIKFSRTKVLLTHVVSILMAEFEKTKNTWSSKYNMVFELEEPYIPYKLNDATFDIGYRERDKYIYINFYLYIDKSDPNSGDINVRINYSDYPHKRSTPKLTTDKCHSIGMIVPVIKSKIQYFLDRAKKIHDEI